MRNKKRAVLYIRVSTDEQKEKGFSQEAQEEKLRSYCEKHAIEIVALYREDHSAKGFNRPEYSKFLSDFRAKKLGKIDYFLVTQYSRFSRSLHGGLSEVERLKKNSIELRAIEQPVNDAIPEDSLLKAIYMVLPEIENSRLSLRTKEGIRKAQQNGCFTSKPPFGYERKWYGDGDKFAGLEQKPVEAKVIEEIFNLFVSQKMNGQEIRKHVNEKHLQNFSYNQIYNILENKVYSGFVRSENEHGECEFIRSKFVEAIISEEIFNQAQNLFKRPAGPAKITDDFKPGFVLHKILCCSNCGRPLTPSNCKGNGGVYSFYECKYRPCTSKLRIRSEEALKKVVGYLDEIKIPKELIAAFVFYYKKQINNLDRTRKNQIKNHEMRLAKLDLDILQLDKDRYINKTFESDIDAYTRLKDDLKNQRSAIEEEIVNLNSLDVESLKKAQYAGYVLENMGKLSASKNPVEFRQVVRTITGGTSLHPKGDVRTIKQNAFIVLMQRIATETANNKKRPEILFPAFTLSAPSPGLEPGTP